MNRICELITWVFDPLHYFYEHEKVHRKISFMLVLVFISGLLIIELKRRQLLPEQLAAIIPKNHFYAISWAFTMILVLEVISLIFTLPCSFSRSVGKQFEILSLILIRNAFKELSYFQEPVTFIGNQDSILHILSSGFGAFIIFALLSVYYKLQKGTYNERDHVDNIFKFVAAKKGVALFLLLSFATTGMHSFYLTIAGIEHTDFFHGFYTLLILTDILVVLIAQCFHPAFYTIFRNSGFALSTLIIRIALVAPVYFDVLLGVAAIILAILLTVISSKMFPEHKHSALKNSD